MAAQASYALDPAPRRGRHRARAVALACLAGALALIALIGLLASPATAHAEVPLIGPLVETAEGVGHAILHPADAVLEALLKILRAVFGGIEAKFIAGVITALLTVPNFDSAHVAALEQTTVAIAAGMLGAVLTLSVIRYYVAGLSDAGAGGFEALQGLVRVTGAVAFIILWPGIFNELAKVPALFDAALLGSGSVQHNVALLFDAALVVGSSAFAIGTGVGLIFTVLIAFLAAIVFIALLWMKVLLAILMMFLYVSMPLAAVLWPVPELSWLLSSGLRAMAVALIVPCVWAILFALASAINADILTWVPTHSVLDTLIVRPLAGLTLMLLCITIPRSLMASAMGAHHHHRPGPWLWRGLTFGMFATRTTTTAARGVATAAAEGSSSARGALDALPAFARAPRGPGEGSVAARIVYGKSGYDRGAGRASEAKPPEGGRRAGQAPLAAAGSETQSALAAAGAQQAIARHAKPYTVAGIERPPYDRGLTTTARETMQARARMDPPDGAAVAAAMREFPAQTQRSLAQLYSGDGRRLREFAASHLHSPSLSASQRDALLTLGSAATPSLRQGVGAALSDLGSTSASAGVAAEEGSPGPGPAEPSTQPAASGLAGEGHEGSPPARVQTGGEHPAPESAPFGTEPRRPASTPRDPASPGPPQPPGAERGPSTPAPRELPSGGETEPFLD